MSETFIFLILIVFVASILQTSTGFGFSIVGTPFLLIIFPVHVAIQINIILSIFISFLLILPTWKDVDRQLLFKLIKGSIIGLVIGLLIFLFAQIELLKLSIGVIILILCIFLMLDFTIKRTGSRDFFTGGLSGILTTSIGVPGPPLLIYFAGTKMDKATVRSTALAYFIFVFLISLAMQSVFGETNKLAWQASFIALLPLIIGIYIGQILFKRINQKMFQSLINTVLICTGLYLILSSTIL